MPVVDGVRFSVSRQRFESAGVGAQDQYIGKIVCVAGSESTMECLLQVRVEWVESKVQSSGIHENRD